MQAENIVAQCRKAGFTEWSTMARPNVWHPLDGMLSGNPESAALMPQSPAEITIKYSDWRPFTVNLR